MNDTIRYNYAFHYHLDVKLIFFKEHTTANCDISINFQNCFDICYIYLLLRWIFKTCMRLLILKCSKKLKLIGSIHPQQILLIIEQTLATNKFFFSCQTQQKILFKEWVNSNKKNVQTFLSGGKIWD